ncbi:kinase-like protein [Meredithblackwellia eburnea MCA 4105]
MSMNEFKTGKGDTSMPRTAARALLSRFANGVIKPRRIAHTSGAISPGPKNGTSCHQSTPHLPPTKLLPQAHCSGRTPSLPENDSLSDHSSADGSVIGEQHYLHKQYSASQESLLSSFQRSHLDGTTHAESNQEAVTKIQDKHDLLNPWLVVPDRRHPGCFGYKDDAHVYGGSGRGLRDPFQDKPFAIKILTCDIAHGFSEGCEVQARYTKDHLLHSMMSSFKVWNPYQAGYQYVCALQGFGFTKKLQCHQLVGSCSFHQGFLVYPWIPSRTGSGTPYKLALHLCWALAFLESKGIVHRDVKLENILVGDGPKFLLADFEGSLSLLEEPCSAEHYSATFEYCPPEVFESENRADGDRWTSLTLPMTLRKEKMDVWAMGCTLIEVLRLADCEAFPFPSFKEETRSLSEMMDCHKRIEKMLKGYPEDTDVLGRPGRFTRAFYSRVLDVERSGKAQRSKSSSPQIS